MGGRRATARTAVAQRSVHMGGRRVAAGSVAAQVYAHMDGRSGIARSAAARPSASTGGENRDARNVADLKYARTAGRRADARSAEKRLKVCRMPVQRIGVVRLTAELTLVLLAPSCSKAVKGAAIHHGRVHRIQLSLSLR